MEVCSTADKNNYNQWLGLQRKSARASICKLVCVFAAASCSPLTLRQPSHGSRVCSRNDMNNGYTCTLACDTGFVFYDQPSQSSLVYSCTDGGNWNAPTPTPKCTQAGKHFFFLKRLHSLLFLM
jgi:hypothetical protein